MFLLWSELVSYLEGIFVLCVLNEELTQLLTLFPFAVFLSVRAYNCWSAFLCFLSVLLSLIFSESTKY